MKSGHKSLTIEYFSGGPRERALQALIDSRHTVERVFVNDPNVFPKVEATIRLAERHGIPVEVVTKADLLGLIPAIAGKTVISVGFCFLFPEPFIDACEICLNVHGTLLPKYRGFNTLYWVLENGEAESGVTVHKVDEGADTGPILLQRSFPLSPFDMGPSLYKRTLEFEPGVLIEALDLLASGNAEFTAQEDEGVIDYPPRSDRDMELDPTQPLNQLINKIRAADPVNCPAYFYLGGQKVCVKLWHPDVD